MRGRPLLLSPPFRFYAAPAQVLSQHAVPCGSMAGSGTDQGLTVTNQPRSFNKNATDLLPFWNPTVRPLPAEIEFDNAYALRDIAVKSYLSVRATSQRL